MTSYKTPTNEQVAEAISLLGSPQHRTYFFSRLDNPRWIGPLRSHDFFLHPPALKQLESGFQAASWPEGEYLARMAGKVPHEVADVLTDLRSDNPFVNAEILNAAVDMPAEQAIRLVPAVCDGIASGGFWLHSRKPAEFCATLASAGWPAESMKLAKSLFSRTLVDELRNHGSRDVFWLKEGLDIVVPELAVVASTEFVRLLCELLASAIQSKQREGEGTRSDYSHVWRPAIQEHDENSAFDLRATLVGHLRNAFELAIRRRSLSLDDSVLILAEYHSLVFQRIRVHLIGEFADANHALAREVTMSRSMFDNFRFRNEYAMVVGKRFGDLTSEDSATWFQWVKDGPENDSGSVSKDRLEYWQYEKLHLVRDYIEGDRRTFYESMLKQHGPPPMANMNFRSDPVQWGEESPVSAQELASWSFASVLEYLTTWRPESQRRWEVTIDGLAKEFAKYIETDPVELSTLAPLMQGMKPIFVRHFIRQLRDSLSQFAQIDVVAVLDLCKWVLEQPLKKSETSVGDDDDHDWQWTRDEVSEFIQVVTKLRDSESPRYKMAELRVPVWQLLEALCRDTPQSYICDDVSKSDPRTRDFLTHAINSPRGKAVEAAFDYARWVAAQLDSTGISFVEMPEFRGMLEWQMLADNRSFEAFAIIGSRIPTIYTIDKPWLAENADRLFALEGIDATPIAPHGWATWNTFVAWVQPHSEYFELFKKQFEFAASQAAHVTLPHDGTLQPMERLGEHLMLLYGWGHLTLQDSEGILAKFLSDAVGQIRRHAIAFVGSSLRRTESPPTSIVERFRTLWDHYWAVSGRKDAAEAPDAWLFGTWVECDQFEAGWVFAQLEQLVEVAPVPQPDHDVAEWLARNASLQPLSAARILDRMVRGDREGWHIHSWIESAQSILRTAIEASGDAERVARDLVNFLGRRGFHEFGNLLRP
jgi:hypothetical protein